MRTRAWIAVMLGLLAAVASCGGKKASSTSNTTVTTGLSISTTTVPKFSGSANSKYCNIARQFSGISTSTLSSDPKTLFQQFDSLSGQFLAAVPSEIKGDANTVVNTLKQLETAVKAANYDFTKVDPAVLALFQDPKFTAATNRIDAYDTQVCGLGPTST